VKRFSPRRELLSEEKLCKRRSKKTELSELVLLAIEAEERNGLLSVEKVDVMMHETDAQVQPKKHQKVAGGLPNQTGKKSWVGKIFLPRSSISSRCTENLPLAISSALFQLGCFMRHCVLNRL
jgi:hypothetical protein